MAPKSTTSMEILKEAKWVNVGIEFKRRRDGGGL
jgi:hypothetical protein